MPIRLGDLILNVRDKSYAKMSVVHVNGLWTFNCFFLINIKIKNIDSKYKSWYINQYR